MSKKQQSEFDPYLNLTYVYLDKNQNGLCIDNGRYLKNRSLSESIDDVENVADKAEKLATDAIGSDAVEIFNAANDQLNRLEALEAKMELCFIPYKDN